MRGLFCLTARWRGYDILPLRVDTFWADTVKKPLCKSHAFNSFLDARGPSNARKELPSVERLWLELELVRSSMRLLAGVIGVIGRLPPSAVDDDDRAVFRASADSMPAAAATETDTKGMAAAKERRIYTRDEAGNRPTIHLQMA
mmetsp:Transcript_37992/g.108959  ORF Transcript_37992/g.108959 Transcript_37992/m.108959 type:complete len:144 (-) Transcript_37992:12-443(-)